MTGAKAGAGDAVALGLAHDLVPSARMAECAAALAEPNPIDAIVARFAAPAPASMLAAQRALLENCFGRPTPLAIIGALGASAEAGSAFARTAREAMLSKSPTSQAIVLRQMEAGLTLSFEEAMTLEFRVVSRICRGHDFYEGVRAVIVDKDNRPRWRPATHDEVSPADVAAYFAPLGETDLFFEAAGR
jgi:enoyl-CoA hydratase